MDETDFSGVPEDVREKYALPSRDVIDRFVGGSGLKSVNQHQTFQMRLV
jgi:hypothetical protein